MTDRLCVIGGDAAGMSAASQVRRAAKGIDIVVYEKGGDVSYSACGIPYFLAGLVSGIDDLVARTAAQFTGQGIDVRLGHEVTEIDLQARRLEVIDHERGEVASESFDMLMIGTGGRAWIPPGLEAAHPAHNLVDARAIDALISGRELSRVVVAGGGYIGLEMAEAFRMRNIETHMVEREPHVMATLDADMAELVEEGLTRSGVQLHLGTGIESIVTNSQRVTGVVTTQGEIPCDLVVAGLGARPVVEIAGNAGITLGASGAIAVDHRQRTSADGVFAAGDCAEVYHLVLEKWVNIHLGTIANKGGRVAGLNIAGHDASFPGVVGTAMSRICDTEIARTGVSEREAKEAGFDYASATVSTSTRAHYFPGAGEMRIKVLAEHGSRRVLGGQIVGSEGAAKRIDVLATAVTQGLTVDEVIDLDLSYAPPFSSVWDPVQVAARRVAAELG